MIVILLSAAILMAQAATPAVAVPPAEPAGTPAAATVSPLVISPQTSVSKRREVDLSEVICQNELPPGTRFAIKVCAPRGQFLERTRQQQDLVREWQATPISSKQ